jgi:hypothetical protein
MKELLELVAAFLAGGVSGYAFRGKVGAEVKKLGADAKADVTKAEADVKAKL